MAEFIPSFHAHRITIDAVQRAVADQFGLTIGRLCEKSNSRPVVVPRQIAMYLARHLTGASFPRLGLCFGARHHTTVMHAVSKIERQRDTDQDLAAVIGKLETTLRENGGVCEDAHSANAEGHR